MPLLYLVYTNDLPEVVGQKVVQFADHMFLTISGWTKMKLKSQIIKHLENMDQYPTNNNFQNLLILIHDKTKLGFVRNINVLRFNIDYSLAWRSLIDRLTKKKLSL